MQKSKERFGLILDKLEKLRLATIRICRYPYREFAQIHDIASCWCPAPSLWAIWRQGFWDGRTHGRLPSDVSSTALAPVMSGAYDRAVLDGFGANGAERLSIRQVIKSL